MRLSDKLQNAPGGWLNSTVAAALFALLIIAPVAVVRGDQPARPDSKLSVGAYYFDGWSSHNHRLARSSAEPWARNAPRMLTLRMAREFPQREPVWGWRDDSLSIMERQIDLAADNGIAFFAFCWYWHDNGKAIDPRRIESDSLNLSLQLFLKARNRDRMKFCLLVANHEGFYITGTEAWKQAADYWMPLLTSSQSFRVDGKPLIIIFSPQGADKEGLAYLQDTARKAGLPGVAVAGCGGGTLEEGFTLRTQYNVVPGYNTGSEEHTYAELQAAGRKAWGGTPGQPYIPTVTGGWDKRPWEGPDGLEQPAGWYFPDRTPEQFAEALRSAVDWLDQHPEQAPAEQVVLVYAWNEFGEGGFIAPTKGDPEGQYLKVIRELVKPSKAR